VYHFLASGHVILSGSLGRGWNRGRLKVHGEKTIIRDRAVQHFCYCKLRETFWAIYSKTRQAGKEVLETDSEA